MKSCRYENPNPYVSSGPAYMILIVADHQSTLMDSFVVTVTEIRVNYTTDSTLNAINKPD